MASDEPLISVAEAARKLRLNKSTLSRQIAKGAIRTRAGGVLLSEVQEDRRKNLYPRRSGRHAGKRDHETVASKPAPEALPPLSDAANAALDASLTQLRHAGAIVAKAAIALKLPMQAAYALDTMVLVELSKVADQHLEAQFGGSFDTLECFGFGELEPDWPALAAEAGQPLDIDAWSDALDRHPWSRPPSKDRADA